MLRMDEEMSYYGTSLNDLAAAGLEIYFGEFGIGTMCFFDLAFSFLRYAGDLRVW